MHRRDFLRRTSSGLAVVTATGIRLRPDAEPTPSDGDFGEHRRRLGTESDPSAPVSAQELVPTTADDLGPFHRKGSIYRGKLTPPFEPGSQIVITGRVWGFDTKRPLAGAVLDLWHADDTGDYEGPEGDVRLRIRALTDEQGYYEYETVYPGHYQGRPAHIHYIVAASGYESLTTQLYFRGDENNWNERERLAERPTQITHLERVATPRGNFRRGMFDLVLSRSR